MGKTEHKKLKEQKKDKGRYNLIPKYMTLQKKDKYYIYQLDFIIEDLKQDKKIDEFAKSYGFSNRQVKIIRQILKFGNQNDINTMYECKYTLISILNMINLKKKVIKKVEKKR